MGRGHPALGGRTAYCNLYFGQFIFAGHEPDISIFVEQAQKYGFNEADYLNSLAALPRYTYEQVARIMSFLTKFATLISNLNHNRIRIEEAFNERELLLNTLKVHSLVLDQIGDSVWVSDLRGNLTYVNSSECRSSGYSKEEMIGKHISFLGDDPRSSASFEEIIQDTVNHGSSVCTLMNYTKDGRLRCLQVNTAMVKDAHGTPFALCATAREIEPK